MNELTPVGHGAMTFGLLMETAQAHQKLAETHLETLRAHTADLDAVVREEIRRTLVDEMRSLTVESDRAVRALRAMRRAANLRGMLWNVVIAVACTAVPTAFAHWTLPSAAEVAELRTQRNALARDVAALELRGGNVDWQRCGEAARLCVRIDRKAPTYGEKADYLVVKGY